MRILIGFPLCWASRTFGVLSIKDYNLSRIIVDQVDEAVEPRETVMKKYRVLQN